MKLLIHSLALLGLLAGIHSCDVINPAEEIPTFIRVDSVNFVTSSGTEGSNSHAIRDVQIFVDNQPVGWFELPAIVPAIHSEAGPAQVSIFGGVFANGNSFTRETHPFMRASNVDMVLTPGDTQTLIPEIRYVDGLSFPILNDFESGNAFVAGAGITSDDEEVFEGQRSAKATIDQFNTELNARMMKVALPGKSTPVWMEFDYRCDVPFHVWVRAYDTDNGSWFDHYQLTIGSKETWNHIYIELTPVVTGSRGDEFEIYFEASLPADTNQAAFYWDNLKIVHN